MDLQENPEGNVKATFELPGIKKEDVQINVHNGLLTVSGENKFESDKEEHGYVVRERRFGKFSRTLQLPQGVKVSTMQLMLDWIADTLRKRTTLLKRGWRMVF
jgi:HSP20 family protein